MKRSEHEEHRNKFLQVKKILHSQHDYFALARALKKPFKWYEEYTVKEAVEILKNEAVIKGMDNQNEGAG